MIFALEISWQDIAVYTSCSVLVHCTTVKCYPMSGSYKSDIFYFSFWRPEVHGQDGRCLKRARSLFLGLQFVTVTPRDKWCVHTIWKGLSSSPSLHIHHCTIYKIELYCFIQVCLSILINWKASSNLNFEEDIIEW